MKITNKNGFPEALLKAIRNDGYSKGGADFSATELLLPPRIRALRKKHEHEIEEDAEDRIWSLYGQLVHTLLERANENDLAEKRFFAKYGKHTVSAQVDTMTHKDGVLSDYKFSTAWKFTRNADISDWIKQLNIQADILRKNGIIVNRLQIIGLIRDFSKPEAFRNKDYPQTSVVTVPIPMWSPDEAEIFIEDRIKLHLEAEKSLPECSEDERWAKPTKWALMKKGQKRAVKLFDSAIEAREVAEMTKDACVEERPGVSMRCLHYCPVNIVCRQFVKLNIGESDDQGSGSVA